jgi:hypothetical protein
VARKRRIVRKRKLPRKRITARWKVSTFHPRDALATQIMVRAKIPKGVRITRSVIEQAVRFRAATGKNPPGFDVRIVKWRNENRRRAEDRAWRGVEGGRNASASQIDRWLTLGRAIQSRKNRFQKVRRQS